MKALPGWQRDKHFSINQRLGNNGGRLEIDVNEYNEASPPEARCRARQQADAYRDERALRDSLKEVWE